MMGLFSPLLFGHVPRARVHFCGCALGCHGQLPWPVARYMYFLRICSRVWPNVYYVIELNRV